MELLIIVAYAGILAMVAPFVLPRSDFYGRLVPVALATVSGSALWLLLTWVGFHYDQAWIWFIVMLAMPAVAWFGTLRIDSMRKSAEEDELERLRLGR